MNVDDLLLDLYGRIPDLVRDAVDGLSADQLATAPASGANPIGWLVWHLARVQDHHVAELLGEEQLWAGGEWAAAFALEADPANTGYGHDGDDVASVRPDGPGALLGYYEAVHARTVDVLRGLNPEALARIVDRRWDPPVTLGVRLVSIADDSLQHVGQAAYLRGLFGW